jgi:hypothetical protein
MSSSVDVSIMLLGHVVSASSNSGAGSPSLSLAYCDSTRFLRYNIELALF